MVERHYCKFCNAWTQGDKAAVRHHEQGRRHREKVEEALKRQRQTKTDAQRSERELHDQLRAIEEEALARHAQDLAASGAPPPPSRGGRPPPPPPRRTHDDPSGKRFGNGGDSAHRRRRDDDDDDRETSADAEQQPEEQVDDFGVYEARGDVFLEGKRHEEKLETGSACEVWVEEAEEWLSALIEKAEVLEIPNTGRSFRRLTVAYMVPGEPQPVTESDVYADRLRIRMPPGMTLETAQRTIRQLETGEVESVEQAPVVVLDETTGMGEWSTVTVREIDESEEAVALRDAEATAEAAAIAELEKRREALEDFSSQGDNALGAYNPWGGSYKGVQLDKELAAAASHQDDVDAIRISTNGDVGFKKRRKAAAGDKKPTKQKRIRASDDD